MNPSIPASAFVNVNPGVVGAGGTGLSLNGLLLSEANRVPQGQVLSFATAGSVTAYFGAGSVESNKAAVYFGGFTNSRIKPGALLISNYAAAPVAGYVRGGKATALTLAQLQAIAAGPIGVTADGVHEVTANINFAGVPSFTAAAALIETALTTATSTALCTFDATAGAFVITSATTGAASTIAVDTTALATAIFLTAATGAVTSPGAIADTPAGRMGAIAQSQQNWATFSTTWEPDTNTKVAFAAWTNTTNDRFAYVFWDTSAAATLGNDTTSAGHVINSDGYSGTMCIYSPSDQFASDFVMGAVASTDFEATNGRITLAFKNQTGLAVGVTDEQTLANLVANGYNAYVAAATAAQAFQFYSPGQISGPFKWADSYINQIWLNNAFQLALMELLTAVNSIPYNALGYGLIQQALADPINAALNAGVIRTNVPLSAAQVAEVNAAAGLSIDGVLSTRGWYLQIVAPTAQVRVARGSPEITFWYMDGESVQQINLASINVQ